MQKDIFKGCGGQEMADIGGHVYAIREAVTNAVLIGLQYLHIAPHKKYHGLRKLRSPLGRGQAEPLVFWFSCGRECCVL